MKKLGKLTLHELDKSLLVIDSEQVNRLKGGNGSDYPYYCPGESYCYGGYGGAAERALAEVGICELSGNLNSELIMSYFKSVKGDFSKTSSWCSAFVNSMMNASGIEGTDSALASSWKEWGTATTTPKIGDIAVYSDGSHVGIVTSVDNGVVMLTAGNSGSAGCVRTGSYGDWEFRTGN